ALLIAVNFFSFSHYLRFDWTRSNAFTLPADIETDLRKLHGDTTIVVYQRHKTFGALTEKPDRYDYAAERKVVEKVKDLVEQFRTLGPTFGVHVLDVEEEQYDKQLADITDKQGDQPARPKLREAIEAATANSIFST